MPVTEGSDSIAPSTLLNPAQLIAWSKADSSSNGALYGKYPSPFGAGIGSVSIPANSQQGLGLGCANFPVRPGSLLRVKFRMYAFGLPNANNEWYFYLMASLNGAAYASAAEFRLSPSGLNSPSPYGEFLYQVPAGVTTLSLGIDATGGTSAGTVYRFNSGYVGGYSHFTVEDMGMTDGTIAPALASTLVAPTWFAAPLASGASASDASRPPQMCKDAMGFVHVRGWVKGTSGQAVLNLPVGYRPTSQHDFPVGGVGGNYASVIIVNDGRVIPLVMPGAVNGVGECSLHTIQFYAG